MTMLADVYNVERTKWDTLAAHKGAQRGSLVTDENFHEYAERVSTMVGVSRFLGDLHDKQVGEYGCGFGEISVLLANSGANVTTFDLSQVSAAVTQDRAVANHVEEKVRVAVAAGEALPYADESFDILFGKAILHHCDVNLGWPELYRILKPGGKAVFVEPLGMNPLLKFARSWLPYPSKNPRGADRPLNYQEIDAWGKQFREFHYQEIQLLSMLERGLGFKRRLPKLRRFDNYLLRHVPMIRRYCRYVVMFMVK